MSGSGSQAHCADDDRRRTAAGVQRPGLDDVAETLPVKVFVARLAVESFDKAVLREIRKRNAWPTGSRLGHAGFAKPSILAAVVVLRDVMAPSVSNGSLDIMLMAVLAIAASLLAASIGIQRLFIW